jgi:hypothetical protein
LLDVYDECTGVWDLAACAPGTAQPSPSIDNVSLAHLTSPIYVGFKKITVAMAVISRSGVAKT